MLNKISGIEFFFNIRIDTKDTDAGIKKNVIMYF